MQPFWKRRLLNQDIILNRIDGYVKDEEFYFFIYKRAPQYGMEFGKVEVGKYLLINCTEYVHTHFENLVRGFNLDSDDLIEIINDPIVVKAIGISPTSMNPSWKTSWTPITLSTLSTTLRDVILMS